MIKTSYFAEQIESGLNAINTIQNTEFIVSADVAKFKTSTRDGNTVTNYINCLLTSAPNANETANGGLVIAIDQFTLQVLVPLEPIKTTPTEDPQAWEDIKNTYVQTVKGIVDSYLSSNNTGAYNDGVKTYAVGYTYAMSSTGGVATDSVIGQYIGFSASIAAMIVENGINSMDVIVTIDGKRIPYQSLEPSRNAVQETNTYSDSTATKTLASATTFALNIASPALQEMLSTSEWIVGGGVNKAHFVGLTYGDETRYYLMQHINARAMSAGVTSVGETYSLAECPYSPDILDFSDDYTVTPYSFDAPTGQITVTAPSDGTYIVMTPDGVISEMTAGSSKTVDVPETGMFFDGQYYAYVVRCRLED